MLLCLRGNMRNAGRQPNFRRRRKIDCSSHERYQRLAGSEPCKINFLYFSCRICVSILWRCVRGDMHDAGLQPYRRRRRSINCGSLTREQQLAGSEPCEINFGIFVAAQIIVCFVPQCVGVDMRDADGQPNFLRRRKIDRSCHKREQQLKGAGPCAIICLDFRFLLSLLLHFIAVFCRADMCCAELQRNRRRRRSIDCGSLTREQQLAGSEPCEINFGIFVAARLSFVLSRSASGVTCAMQYKCRIGDDGAKSIAAAMNDSSSVEALNLVRSILCMFISSEFFLKSRRSVSLLLLVFHAVVFYSEYHRSATTSPLRPLATSSPVYFSTPSSPS